MYTQSGITMDKATLVEGKNAKLTYHGNLYNQGAEDIYVHLGFGLLWEALTEIKMTKNDQGFSAEIPLTKADTLYLCFRDNYNNWDNNSYQNYSYDIGKKKLAKTHHETKSSIATNNTFEYRTEASAIIVPKVDSDMIENMACNCENEIFATESLGTISKPIEMAFSLVNLEANEFSPFRRLPENYLRNKKMRIMFYRMFAYVPRLLNGYTKKKASTIFKNNGLFR
jgi:hypothetical protein